MCSGSSAGLEIVAGRRRQPARRAAAASIHQTSSVLVHARRRSDVLVLPAVTRYESEGGGTETSTERRIIFARDSGGASARPPRVARVWARVARACGADKVRERRGDSRKSPARFRALWGIETLNAKGDQVQWVGRCCMPTADS
jgi:hypothetical protein